MVRALLENISLSLMIEIIIIGNFVWNFELSVIQKLVYFAPLTGCPADPQSWIDDNIFNQKINLIIISKLNIEFVVQALFEKFTVSEFVYISIILCRQLKIS